MVLPATDRDELERVINEEISRFQEQPVTEEELARAKKQTRAHYAFGLDSMSNQGRWLGLSSIVATTDWFVNYLDSLEAVTASQVQSVAQRYLVPTKRTVGWYIPENGANNGSGQ
jgi:zinc protease